MWSLQPHCGNIDCGPQIRQNRFNLWRHSGLHLMVVVYLCVSAKHSNFHLLQKCFAFGSGHAEPSQKKEHFFCRFQSTCEEIRHTVLKMTQYIHSCAGLEMYFCPMRGLHTVSLVCLSTAVVLCLLCGYIGEKLGSVTVSQKTPAGWLSWRLLISA